LPVLSNAKKEAIDRIGFGLMDKLWIEFPSVFWTDDLENDWILYISDNPGEWVETLNIKKFLDKPILVMFNVGDVARTFADKTDNEIIENAMKVLRNIYPTAPEPIGFKRSNWSKE